MQKITIAIDGYSSCGKSTLAKALAQKLNYSYIDTGAMYRAVAVYALQNNFFVDHVINETELINSFHSYETPRKAKTFSKAFSNGTIFFLKRTSDDVGKHVA